MERAGRAYSATSERQRQALGLGRAVDIARELGVTSKQVWAWKSRQDVNGFPAPIACTWTPWRDGRFKGVDLWEMGEVREWFKTYDPRKQQARGGGRNPNGRRGGNGIRG